jgi:hypothetical protein
MDVHSSHTAHTLIINCSNIPFAGSNVFRFVHFHDFRIPKEKNMNRLLLLKSSYIASAKEKLKQLFRFL